MGEIRYYAREGISGEITYVAELRVNYRTEIRDNLKSLDDLSGAVSFLAVDCPNRFLINGPQREESGLRPLNKDEMDKLTPILRKGLRAYS